jgi:hypothetical protein
MLIPMVAHASDGCLQTRVHESFVSPDGKVRGPGTLRVCPFWTISPTVRLSRVQLNGQTLGVWMSRASEGGRFEKNPTTLTLRRLPEGRVALANYYWPGRDGRPEAPGLRVAELVDASPELATAPLVP